MKHAILALAAVSTLAAAGAASAQPYGYGRPDGSQLERRIEMAARRGDLSWREAQALRAEIDQVQRLEWRYSRDGLSTWERRDLDRRYAFIEQRVRFERHDGDGRHGGYGYGHGYGRHF